VGKDRDEEELPPVGVNVRMNEDVTPNPGYYYGVRPHRLIMDGNSTYVMTLRPNRENFIATMTPEEKAAMGQHFLYSRGLFDEGKIIIGGAATDGSIGIIIFRAGSPEEARQIFENDPAVRAGIGQAEVHPFRIGLIAGQRSSGE